MSTTAETPLSHIDSTGRAVMVNVGGKLPTAREAHVEAAVVMSPQALAALQQRALAKGDAAAVARAAGFLAAKRTAELIPLCHPIPIEHMELAIEPDEAAGAVRISCCMAATAKTGVEMEAFTAVAVAALTLYDMIKAVDPAATITGLRLVSKTGGKQPYERRS